MLNIANELSRWKECMSEQDFNSLVNYVDRLRSEKVNNQKQFLGLYGTKGKTTLRKEILRIAGLSELTSHSCSLSELIENNEFENADVITITGCDASSMCLIVRLTSNDLAFRDDKIISLSKHVICEFNSNPYCDSGPHATIASYREIPINITLV